MRSTIAVAVAVAITAAITVATTIAVPITIAITIAAVAPISSLTLAADLDGSVIVDSYLRGRVGLRSAQTEYCDDE